jgi:hypothetical protein
MFAKDTGDPDDQSVQLRVALDDKPLTAHSVAFSFGGKPRNRVLITLNGLSVPGPGVLAFSFCSPAGEPLGSPWTVIVEKAATPEGTAAS